MKDLFVNTQLPVVTSDRILYTPSNFARTSLLYLQEIGSLRVHKPHSTGRSNLSSYLFFTVTDGEGELICEGRTYSLRTGDCVFIDCRKQYAHSSSEKLWSLSWIHFYARIDHLVEKNVIKLHDGDLSDSSGLIRLVGEIRPDEIYNLAAQSHVQVSFDAPEYSGDVDALGVLRVLEAVRVCGLTKTCKVYQASTSELYGKVEEVPQKETTPFHPYSPYAVAKQYGFWMVKEYCDAYGMFAVNGILFNHESERRGENFVTRKITLAAGRIAEGLQDHLELGNMDSLRDWGYAKDYVECMWLIMQQEKPEDFVIATGVQHTVRDFTEKAFAANGMTIRWEGTGIDEKGYDAATGKMLVCVNPQWFRPTDVDNLWGDPTKAKTVLGWNPQKTSYEELVEIMAKNDRELAKREKAMKAVM